MTEEADVDQVSLPMRIALAAVLSFAALWFVALRPKPVADVAAEPVSAPKAAPAKPAASKPAAAKPAASKPAAAKPAASKPAASKPAASRPAAKPAVAPRRATPPAPKTARGADAVVADIKSGRTVVLLFWDAKSTDDKAVRRAVERIDRRDGRVRVRVANLRQISRYGAITQGVPVTSSPTTLVIGKDGKAEAIRGLTVTGEIDDVVSGVLRRAK